MARWGDVDKGDEKNFWRMAELGPCGPCSEIHFDRGAHLSGGAGLHPGPQRAVPALARDLEPRLHGVRPAARRSRVLLPFGSVDTGLGLERVASAVQQVMSNYDTDLFTPIHARMRELLGHDPDAFEAERFSYQVIADHSRAVTFLIADGVLPSNEGRGYVLRKLLRRAVRHGRLLGRTEPFLGALAEVVIEVMADAYPHLVERRSRSSPGSSARRPSSRGRSTPARACSRRSSRSWRPASASSAGARRTCRPTRRASTARSRSASTTRTASRTT